MQRLWPTPPMSTDATTAYAAQRQPPADRPWTMLNMIASLDGATTLAGRSGGLGGPADQTVFHTLRGMCDVILVGAGTVRAERYRPTSVDGPLIAVVSNRLDLEWEWPLFQSERTVIITAHESPSAPSGVRTIRCGLSSADLAEAMGVLRAEGHNVVLCEGGPMLNGQLIAEQLVDELCLTLAPMLVAGTSNRVATGPVPAAPLELGLVHLLSAEGMLFLRYARETKEDASA